MTNTTLKFHQVLPYRTNLEKGAKALHAMSFAEERNRELFRLRASRLADFFPDELVIQEKTISLVKNQFLVSFMETMPVKDIGRVVYVKTPIFGGLHIIGKNTQHELRIKGLKKTRAIKAKEIIEGLLLEDSGAVEVPLWPEADRRREMLAEAGRNKNS